MMAAMKNSFLMLSILGAATLPGLTYAGDPEAGKEKSATCVACHGEDGVSPIPANPILAGQHADYLEYTLRGYRSGARANAIMAGMAAALTDEDIADLAAYFSSQSALDILPDGPND